MRMLLLVCIFTLPLATTSEALEFYAKANFADDQRWEHRHQHE